MTSMRETVAEAVDLLVVVGPGRSGTSVLMHLLGEVGIALSDDLVGASEANPGGAFEDAEILQRQRRLIEDLCGDMLLPLPANWRDAPEVKSAEADLKLIVEQRKERPGRWAFKDPQTSLLLPMWRDIFSQLSLRPAYILAIRDPAACMASMAMYYGRDAAEAEVIWLRRTSQAILDCRGDLSVVEYELWTTEGEAQLGQVLDVCGAEELKPRVANVLQQVLRPDWNRAPAKLDVQPSKPITTRLYETIKDFRRDPSEDRRAAMLAAAQEGLLASEDAACYRELARRSRLRLQQTMEANARLRQSVEAAVERAGAGEVQVRALKRLLVTSSDEAARISTRLAKVSVQRERRLAAQISQARNLQRQLAQVRAAKQNAEKRLERAQMAARQAKKSAQRTVSRLRRRVAALEGQMASRIVLLKLLLGLRRAP